MTQTTNRTVIVLIMMMLTTMTAGANDAVTYIDMDGQQQSVTEYTEVTTDMTADGNGYIKWSSGTYVVKSSVTLSGCIRFKQQVIDLIVCDGATLTVNGNEDNGAFDGNTLNIYAQSNGTGMGVVNVKKDTRCNHLNIAGGKVTLDADGKSYGLYVFDGDACGLTVNGGDVTIQNRDGSQGAIFFNSNSFVTLNGGKLTVTNSMGNGYKAIEGQYTNTINFNGGTAVINGCIYKFKNINLNSGNVTVNSEILNVWGYTVTYDFTHATDSYYIKAFSNNINSSATRTVQVKDGVSFLCNGKSYSGTLSNDQIAAISNQTMTPDISAAFSKDSDTEYTIHTAKGWELFCDALQDNETYNRFSGKTVKLGNNIGTAQAPITRMAGSSYHDFCGTFDGDGHTLTVNISSDDITDGSTQYVAPFRYVSNVNSVAATIRNLHVTGNIATDMQFTGGLIGGCWGAVSIENCAVSTAITSTIDGDGGHGGIVGIHSNGTLTITGCVFDGRLLGSTTNSCGGFIGWRGSAAEIRNSLFAPAEVTVMNTSGATFARNTVDTYNCYYTTLLNDGTNYVPALVDGTVSPAKWYNGKALHTVTAAADVTISAIALTGDETHYAVSGITAYSGGGLQLGETLYYGSGDAVSLTLSNTATGAPLGYQYGYATNAGTLSGTTLTMPDQDVTVSAALAPIDWATVNEGNSEDPYMIYNKDQLLLLAHRVNGTNGETANTYQGKYFKLGADITFDHDAVEGDDYAENYEAIGHYDYIHVFNGNFNGDGHTVSGIRINKTDSDNANKCQALFGQTDSDADIHDVHLTDARITGYDYVAGIVAYNYGTVSGCTVTDSYITYNAFDRGTICARNAGTLTNNYYHGCTVNGTPVTSGVGCGYINNGNTTTDITANNGAVPGYFLTLGEGITIAGGATTFTIPARGETAEVTYHVAAAGANVTLSYSGTTGNIPLGYQYGFTASAGTLSGSTLTMPDQDVTISVNTAILTAIPWNGKGTEGSPYLIEYPSQLDLLAYRVNGTHGETANDYYNTYFQLAKDISYPYTSAWNDFTSDENNYEAIGGIYDGDTRYFRGHFDGNNKTISGIRIYKDGHSSTNMYQGIFGWTDSGADIHDLTLADARITGYNSTGGIVGKNYNGGTVENCHALSNVNVHAVQPDAYWHGGIVGDNWGTIEQCTSAATLTTADADNSAYYGGIAGINWSTLRDNLAIGATVPAAADNSYGAITGNNNGSLQRNYYAACKVANTENATGVGCGSIGNADDGYTTADVNNDNNPDGAVSIHTLALALADAADNTAAIADHAGQTLAVALSGRTLYKDGDWNTLCLPFSLGDAEAADGHHFDGTPLEGADVMELDTEGSYEDKTTGLDNGTLYLYFKKANTIAAGTPYIVKWGDKDEPSTLEGLTDLVNPVFTNVTVSNANNDVAFTGGAFKGTYASITYTEENKSILFVGGNNNLYWPTADASIGAQRAYFELNGGQQARNIVLNFFDEQSGKAERDGENATGIHSTTNFTNCTNLAGAWYTLDGRKLSGKPTAPGIYVKDGKKFVLK